MVDIKTNLLKNRKTLTEKEYQTERKMLRYGIFAMIVVVLVAVALSVWNFLLTRQIAKTELAITGATKDMQDLTQASAQQIYLKSRLKLITGFLSERSMTRESLQRVLSTNIDGAHVSALTFEDEAVMAVTYVTDNVLSLNKLIEYYQVDTGYYIQVVSKGISRTKDGKYQLALALTLPKGETKK